MGGGGGPGGRVGGGQGGCERRIEVFVKIQNKKWWVGGRDRFGRVRVDEIEELKFLGNIHQKKSGGGGGGVGSGGGGVRIGGSGLM